jgi:pantoate--beta-alanine ligase
MYPPGFATTVAVGGALTETLEGASRGAAHFHGVATVVAKLLNIVRPDVAYFGQKDAQQALVIARMACDLDMPTAIEVCPTVREPDGLARSSRNAYLGPDDRTRALALSRALNAAAEVVARGERSALGASAAAADELRRQEIDPDYIAVVDPRTLAPVELIEAPVLIAVAAAVGPARLIDNLIVSPNGAAHGD